MLLNEKWGGRHPTEPITLDDDTTFGVAPAVHRAPGNGSRWRRGTPATGELSSGGRSTAAVRSASTHVNGLGATLLFPSHRRRLSGARSEGLVMILGAHRGGDAALASFGESALGAAHAAQHLPNQDAFGFLPRDGFGSPAIVVVADGHGSTRSFRSDVGALIAVNTAIRCLWSRIMDTARSPFRERTRGHRAGHHRALAPKYCARGPEAPVHRSGAHELSGAAGRRGRRAPSRWIRIIAYGTTLLCVAVTSDRLLFFQLGDGDILTVTKYGGVQRVLPVDELIWQI